MSLEKRSEFIGKIFWRILGIVPVILFHALFIFGIVLFFTFFIIHGIIQGISNIFEKITGYVERVVSWFDINIQYFKDWFGW